MHKLVAVVLSLSLSSLLLGCPDKGDSGKPAAATSSAPAAAAPAAGSAAPKAGGGGGW